MKNDYWIAKSEVDAKRVIELSAENDKLREQIKHMDDTLFKSLDRGVTIEMLFIAQRDELERLRTENKRLKAEIYFLRTELANLRTPIDTGEQQGMSWDEYRMRYFGDHEPICEKKPNDWDNADKAQFDTLKAEMEAQDTA